VWVVFVCVCVVLCVLHDYCQCFGICCVLCVAFPAWLYYSFVYARNSHKLKIQYVYKIKTQNSKLNVKTGLWRYTDAQVYTKNNIIIPTFQVCSTNGFRFTGDTYWKLYIVTKSRPISLSFLKANIWKYPGAQIHTTKFKFRIMQEIPHTKHKVTQTP